MNGGVVLPPKHTPAGSAARRLLIERQFGEVPARLAGARADDILDAHAVLWTAERFARRHHVILGPDVPERDVRGLPMRIVV
jgi:predicted RNase H-like nuclease